LEHGIIYIMQRTFGKEVALILIRSLTFIVTAFVIVIVVIALASTEGPVSDGTCNVAVLPLEGVILPFAGLLDEPYIITPDAVETFMKRAEEDPSLQAILVEINSPGGTPVAAERISERLLFSTLPTVGMIGDIGASGGYMVAAATNHIVASAMSDVGSIGVTMSYLEESKKNEEEGLTYVELNTGKFKDAGTPNRPLTDEERALFQRDLDVVHDEFVKIVSRYRDKTVEEIDLLADGSTMTGVRALEVGLIDSIGGRTAAKDALAEILEISRDDIIFCEYDRGLIPF
jgi:protease-4